MRVYLALGFLTVFVSLCGFSYWAWQSREHWKAEAKTAEAALNYIKDEHAKQEVIINDYIQELSNINKRYNASVMRYEMSCKLAPSEGVDGEKDAARYGDPSTALFAYEKQCREILTTLDSLQKTLGE